MKVANTAIEVFFKRLCLVFVFSFFIVLPIQQLFRIKQLKELRGEFVPAKPVHFTTPSWLSGGFQDSTALFLNEDFGFRNFFLRLNNQLKFSLFHKPSGKEVVIGKDNYLYIEGYINGYLGKDFIGDNAIKDTVANLRSLQEDLRQMGKTLLVVLAPGKPRIYPEFLPENLPRTPAQTSNYSSFLREFDAAGINYIDFNNLFKLKKDTSKYLLFPQLGVHWSRLEGVRAADTIMGKLAHISGWDLPRVKITKITEKEELERPDEDVIEGMNMFSYPPFVKMAYPEIEFITKGKVKKNALIISDSFWWDIYLKNIPLNVFGINNFWYYDRDAWGNNFFGKHEAKKEDLKRILLQFDIVIIVNTESNYGIMGFGFIGSAANAMKRPIYPTTEELNDIKGIIKENSEWMSQVKTKAEQKHISVDSAITLDALWRFQKKGPKLKTITYEEIKRSVTEVPEWYADTKAKAIEKNISLDSMITETATWFYNNQYRPEEGIRKQLSLQEVKEKIKNNADWMHDISIKAKQRKISLDSMITLDAIWFKEQQQNQ